MREILHYRYLATKQEIEVAFTQTDVDGIDKLITLLSGSLVRVSGWVERSETTVITVHLRATGPSESIKQLNKFFGGNVEPTRKNLQLKLNLEKAPFIKALQQILLPLRPVVDPPNGRGGVPGVLLSNTASGGTAHIEYLTENIAGLLRISLAVPNVEVIRLAILQSLSLNPKGRYGSGSVVNFLYQPEEVEEKAEFIVLVLRQLSIKVTKHRVEPHEALELMWTMQGERRAARLGHWRGLGYGVLCTDIWVPRSERDDISEGFMQATIQWALGSHSAALSLEIARQFITARIISVTEDYRLDDLINEASLFLENKRVKPEETALADTEAWRLTVDTTDLLLGDGIEGWNPTAWERLEAINYLAKLKLS